MPGACFRRLLLCFTRSLGSASRLLSPASQSDCCGMAKTLWRDRLGYEIVAEIRRLGPLALYSDFPPLISDVTTAEHLPVAMIEGLGHANTNFLREDIIEVLETTA